MPRYMTAPHVEPVWVSPRTACKMFEWGKTYVFALIKADIVESQKMGKSRRLKVDSLKEVAARGAPTLKELYQIAAARRGEAAE